MASFTNMASFTTMAVYASVPSCFSTTSASRGSRTSRIHRNTGKRPKHHLTLQQIKDVIQYILNYTGKKTSIGTSTCTDIHIITSMPYL